MGRQYPTSSSKRKKHQGREERPSQNFVEPSFEAYSKNSSIMRIEKLISTHKKDAKNPLSEKEFKLG